MSTQEEKGIHTIRNKPLSNTHCVIEYKTGLHQIAVKIEFCYTTRSSSGSITLQSKYTPEQNERTTRRNKMANLRILFFTLLISLSLHVCRSDEESEEDDKKDTKLSFDGMLGEPMKGMGNFFKGAADAMSDTAENGMESLKGLSTGVKETSEAGAEMAKGFADGIGSSFGKAKDKLMETGGKMKEAVGDAAINTKEEIETAASKLSKHAKDASETMMKMFG